MTNYPGTPNTAPSETLYTGTLAEVTITNADTEYSFTVPEGTKKIEVHLRSQDEDVTVRRAWVTGKVATPVSPYQSFNGAQEWVAEGLNLIGKTLYFACSEASQVLEIETWA